MEVVELFKKPSNEINLHFEPIFLRNVRLSFSFFGEGFILAQLTSKVGFPIPSTCVLLQENTYLTTVAENTKSKPNVQGRI